MWSNKLALRNIMPGNMTGLALKIGLLYGCNVRPASLGNVRGVVIPATIAAEVALSKDTEFSMYRFKRSVMFSP
jgi:hypothetical protein